mmetsp:Transcript_7568/g.21000  ORF Transcript_7568/g.21000 Transcript_7568/m.21000 type:complete len:267 (-) Transcript_7568:141-941(-)
MRKRQVGNHHVIWCRITIFGEGDHVSNCPCEVVVRNHHALGWTRRATSVYERARLTRFPRRGPSLKFIVGYILSQLLELLKRVNRCRYFLLNVSWHSVSTIHDESLEIGQIFGDVVIFLQLLQSFANHKLGLGVPSDILTSFCIVGCINSTRNAACRNGPKIGHEPFGRIETNNVDNVKAFKPERYEGFTKCVDLRAVFIPCPSLPLAINLLMQCSLIPIILHSFVPLFHHSHGFFGRSPLSFSNGDFCRHVRRRKRQCSLVRHDA